MMRGEQQVLTKDGSMKPLSEVTKDNYNPMSSEADHYHVKQEPVRNFDPMTGKKILPPYLQKYDIAEWQRGMKERLEQQGWKVEILFDPIAYANEQAEKAQAEAKANAKAEALAEEIERKAIETKKTKSANQVKKEA